jgi:hypothetical protein
MLDLNYKEVAEQFGGDIPRIAQAAAIGALGPYGVLVASAAADHIKRMRAAAAQEQVPQQTVAQQLLSPQPQMPVAPQGLGATPQAATMPAPEAAGLGMAEGGMVPPYAAGGGLSSLPLPDDMFDESRNGGFDDGYAGGGLVAFAKGGDTDTYYGYNYKDPLANLAIRDALFGAPQTKYEEEAEADYLRRRSPEYRKDQRRKDIAQLMAEAGFGMMAGNSPYALQNIGAALVPALGAATERARDRRAEEREIQKGLLDLEQGKNTRAAQRATQALEMQGLGIKGYEEETGRTFRSEEAEKERAYDWRKFQANEAGENYRAGLRSDGGSGGGPKRLTATAIKDIKSLEKEENEATTKLTLARRAWVRAGKPAKGKVKDALTDATTTVQSAQAVRRAYLDRLGLPYSEANIPAKKAHRREFGLEGRRKTSSQAIVDQGRIISESD